MLLAHGTTQWKADQVELDGHFNEGTHFMKMEPDSKLGLFGTAGFAFRDDPITWDCCEKYCRQDLLLNFKMFKNALVEAAEKYCIERADDISPGLIYIVHAERDVLGVKNGLHRLTVPGEVFNTEVIPTTSINHIITLEEHVEHFGNLYGRPVDSMDDMDLTPGSLLTRMWYTFTYRFNRIVLRRA